MHMRLYMKHYFPQRIDDQIHVHKFRFRVNNGMFLAYRNIGRDSTKIRLSHILDNIFQESFYDVSLDWHESRVCWHDYIYRSNAKDAMEKIKF